MPSLYDKFEFLYGGGAVLDDPFFGSQKALYMNPDSLIVNKEEGVRELQNYKITARVVTTNYYYNRWGFVFGYRKPVENGGIADSYYFTEYNPSANLWCLKKQERDGTISSIQQVYYSRYSHSSNLPFTVELVWFNGNYELYDQGKIVMTGYDDSFDRGGWGLKTGYRGETWFDNILIEDVQ